MPLSEIWDSIDAVPPYDVVSSMFWLVVMFYLLIEVADPGNIFFHVWAGG